MYLLMRRWTGSESAGDHRGPDLRVQRARADALRAPAGAPRRVLPAGALRARSRARRAATPRAAAARGRVRAAGALQQLPAGVHDLRTDRVGRRAVARARHPLTAARAAHRRRDQRRRPRAVPVAVLPGQPRQGLARGVGDVAQYNAGWRDYLVTGGRLHLRVVEPRFYGPNGAVPRLHRARPRRRRGRVSGERFATRACAWRSRSASSASRCRSARRCPAMRCSTSTCRS